MTKPRAVPLERLVPDQQFILREGTRAEKEAFALEIGAPAVPRQKLGRCADGGVGAEEPPPQVKGGEAGE